MSKDTAIASAKVFSNTLATVVVVVVPTPFVDEIRYSSEYKLRKLPGPGLPPHYVGLVLIKLPI